MAAGRNRNIVRGSNLSCCRKLRDPKRRTPEALVKYCKAVKAPGYGNFMTAHLLMMESKEADRQYPVAIPYTETC